MAAVTGRDSLPAMDLKASVSGGSLADGPERRSHPRFRIHLPLVVRWLSCSAAAEAVTESQDVSSRGIYFLLPIDIENGSPVEIVMTLPHEITMAGPINVRYLGRVRRTESQPDHRVSVVAKIESYEFLSGNENSALRGPLPTALRLQRI